MKLQSVYALAGAIGAIMLLGTFSHIDQAVSSQITADQGHCNDKEGAGAWVEMLNKYPDDPAVIHLAAYRLGICDLVRQGRVKLDAAIEVFEQERWRVIRRRQDDEIKPKDLTL